MKRHGVLLDRLRLTGLRVAPSQAFGGVRLVPLVRDHVRDDLRLWQRPYGEPLSVVDLGGRPQAGGPSYLSYIPHALVLQVHPRALRPEAATDDEDDGGPVAAWGGQLFDPQGPAARRKEGRGEAGPFAVRKLHRMVRREARDRLRLLPLHLAMEGFLELCFGGPDIRWPEYTRQALRFGLSPRAEWSVSGKALAGLDEALRLFEIHEGQCGALIYVMDALASAFVVPHPDDYRALHRTLLTDFYGPLLLEYSHLPHKVQELIIPPRGDLVLDLADLRAALAQTRAEWRRFHAVMSDRLIDRPLQSKAVYRLGPFQLQRFMTELDAGLENHLGEAIVRDDGALEYLKTYRLSAHQAERARILQTLAAAHWNLAAAGARLGMSRDRFILKACKAGFAGLFKPEVVRDAHAGVQAARPR